MPSLDWNTERYRTRDLLLEHIYPWESDGSQNIPSQKQIIFGTLEEFPENGDLDKLYFDTNNKILYYYDETQKYQPIHNNTANEN